MAQGRQLALLKIADEDRRVLEGFTRRHKTAQQLALRARIVLLCSDGLSNMAVAQKLDTTRETVGR
jgi:DNA-binding NarL/FixJ family response regulator